MFEQAGGYLKPEGRKEPNPDLNIFALNVIIECHAVTA
jgi:hypothetical protein